MYTYQDSRPASLLWEALTEWCGSDWSRDGQVAETGQSAIFPEVADCGPTRVGRGEPAAGQQAKPSLSKDVPEAMAGPGFHELYFVEQLS